MSKKSELNKLTSLILYQIELNLMIEISGDKSLWVKRNLTELKRLEQFCLQSFL